MSMFDTYLMVDWSAKREATGNAPQEAAIWWAVQRASSWRSWQVRAQREEPSDAASLGVQARLESGVFYERTRYSAIKNISCFIRNEVSMAKRVLVGFDFAFGYPVRFLSHLVSSRILKDACAPSLWKWLAQRPELRNLPDNSNRRFMVAGKLNKTYGSTDGLWGPYYLNRGHLSDVPRSVQKEKRSPWPDCYPGEYRFTDKALGAQPASVWKLTGQDSVGSQVLMGLPALHHLSREAFKDTAVVWPFDTRFVAPNTDQGGHPIVFVEIYPSLLREAIKKHMEPNEFADRAQVRLNALAFSLLDSRDQLRPLFLGPRASGTEVPEEQAIANEEGWIFGVDEKLCNRDRLVSALTEHFRPQETS